MIIEKKNNITIILGIIVIFIQHLFFKLSDNTIVRIDDHWQIMHKTFLNNFFENILFFHANPPLLSFLTYLSNSLLGIEKYIILGTLLIILHVSSFLFFYKTLKIINFKYSEIISLIFFLNPLMLLYFNYPFSATFIFFLLILFIYNLYSNKSKGSKLIFATLILCTLAMIRASYHLLIIFFFLLPLMYKVNKKYIIISFIIIFIPLSWYLKNSIMFGKFVSSTWVGMNLATHINSSKTPKNDISKIGRFSKIDAYKDYIDENHPLIKKFDNKFLHFNDRNNMNNVRYILVSDKYFESLKKHFQLTHSFKIIITGIPKYLNSPSSYNVFDKRQNWWIRDLFDLPDLEIKSSFASDGYIFIPFSIYSILYPLVIFIIIINWKNLSFNDKYLLIFLLVMSTMYICIDPSENMRMRFELEAIFYLFTIKASMIVANFNLSKIYRPTKRNTPKNNHKL